MDHIIKGRVSIIIPARNEKFLNKTLQDIVQKAQGDIEVIAMLDGYWPDNIINSPKIRYIHFPESRGMRESINSGARVATGEFLMKLDAHCMLMDGFDIELKKNIEDNWIVIPRRHRLDAEKWEIQPQLNNKPPVDYEFLSSPSHDGAKGSIWTQRILERLDKPEFDIDENMTFQGSCWFMTNNHYTNTLGGMSEVGYGTFVREAQEIGLKTWLGGGKVMTNKKVWYAHLHKGKTYGRMYFLNKDEIDAGNKYCDDFWFNNRWKDRKHDLSWLIERFWPVPSWPEDRSLWTKTS